MTPSARYTAVGLMSGTSLDGLDLCAAEFALPPGADEPVAWRILAAETVPYPDEWLERLSALPPAPAEAFAKAHADYGHYLGLTTRRFLLSHRLKPQVISSHGHTVFHQPWRQFTTQLGCGETLVSHLEAPVVADLRTRDVAQGGQGAPLVPYGESRLFERAGIFVNLGGIVNLSFFRQRLPPLRPDAASWMRGDWRHLAYDVCPGNLVLNPLATRHDPALRYDPDGQLAAQGRVIDSVLNALEALPTYQLPPPRSMGREFVEGEVAGLLVPPHSPADLLATAVEHIARRVAAELDRFGIAGGEAVVTGGGAHNLALIKRLDGVLAERGITRQLAEAALIDYKEALVFAFLGLCTLLRVPNVLPGTTGARTSVIAGAIHLPEAYARPLL